MAPDLSFDIDELVSDVQSLKISALSHAAQISPLVRGCTIGPGSANDIKSITLPTTDEDAENDCNICNTSASSDTVRNAKKSPKGDCLTNESASAFTSRKLELTDCVTVSSKLQQQEIERQRLATMRRELSERELRYREADEARDNQLRLRLQEVKRTIAQKTAQTERQLLAAINEQEREAKALEARRQAEIEEENRRMSEVSQQLKRREEELQKRHQLLETIGQQNSMFRTMMELFTNTLMSVGVQHSTKFTNQKKAVRTLVKSFEQLLQTVNANKDATTADVELAYKFCEQLDLIDAEVMDIVSQIKASEKKEQESAPKVDVPPVQTVVPVQPPATPAPQSVPVAQPAAPAPAEHSNPLAAFVSTESLIFYSSIKTFYEQHQAAVKQLMEDPSMKTYRFNCQKAINTPVNAISAVNRDHFIDKYNRLAALLSGQNVKVSDTVQVSINGHPLGRTYCTMLLAKKFVGQADTMISSNAQAAFPIAAIVVALWQKFPEFGHFFLAYLHKECPYLVPYFIPHMVGESQEDYLKSIGYRFVDGVLEKQDLYLKRMTGLARLYSAVMVTIPKRNETAPHPHGLECGWRWLCNMLNLDPLPDICATLILEILQTVGYSMFAVYGKQFIKLLKLFQEQYLPALNKVDSGGPKARLEGFIVKVATEGKIDPPEGTLNANYW